MRPVCGMKRARVLRVQAYFDRVSTRIGTDVDWFAGRDAQLRLNEIDAGDELGHRMLDLDASVELEEPEVPSVEHELGRAGALVADRARESDRCVAHRDSQRFVDGDRGRLFEHFLVSALYGTLALAESEDVAVRVGEELDLDMAGSLDVALAEHAVVAESGLRLAARGVERVIELRGVAHDSHPAAAAAGCCLDDEGEADLLRPP